MTAHTAPSRDRPTMRLRWRSAAVWLVALAAVAGWAASLPAPPIEVMPWTGTLDI